METEREFTLRLHEENFRRLTKIETDVDWLKRGLNFIGAIGVTLLGGILYVLVMRG